MDSNKAWFNVVVAAAVAAVTAAGISYLSSATRGSRQVSSSAAPSRFARAGDGPADHARLPHQEPRDPRRDDDRARQAPGTEQAEQQAKTISENADAIFRSKVAHVAGNPDGDVTVVEFFDYNCGYCRRALPDVVKLINDDGKVRLVLKELPIFGEESEGAAKIALAADKQGKYFEMHQKLFSESGKANKEKGLAHRQGAQPRHREARKGRRG